MYNFLVTFEDGAWDAGHYFFDKSRFLEYTNLDVAKKFSSLSEKTKNQLQKLPCLFAYENGANTAKIGYIKSIKEKDRNIAIEYEIDKNFPSFKISDIEDIFHLLDIREWEMNRTHWAVKDENLLEILKKYKFHNINIESTIDDKNLIDSLKSYGSKTPEVTSVRGFVNKVLNEHESGNKEAFYRGHSNKEKYKLEPSLFRKDKDGNYLYLNNEDLLYRELIVSNSADFSSDDYTLDRLVRMQHFSLPTRLLDITSNPLIALYFACKSSLGSKEKGYSDEEVGEVITISLQRDKIKYFDSDVASCISNLARLTNNEKRAIDFKLSMDAFNKEEVIKRLVHFIRQEKSFFEPKIEPTDLQRIICVKGKKSNDRIYSQSGAFLLFGFDSILDETGTDELNISRIAVKNKVAILKELDLLNINESTVFPYIENSAKYVAQKYSFKS